MLFFVDALIFTTQRLRRTTRANKKVFAIFEFCKYRLTALGYLHTAYLRIVMVRKCNLDMGCETAANVFLNQLDKMQLKTLSAFLTQRVDVIL